MWNLLGVMVLQRCMGVWRRGWGQSAIGICAFFYMWNLWGVMVLHRSMLNWRRGRGQSAMGRCAFFNMCNLLGVMVLHRSMLVWRRGWGQSAMGICALCYIHMKYIWCNGFLEIYARLEEGWGQSAMGICALCYIWNWFGIMVFQRSLLNWRTGWHCAIYETDLV